MFHRLTSEWCWLLLSFKRAVPVHIVSSSTIPHLPFTGEKNLASHQREAEKRMKFQQLCQQLNSLLPFSKKELLLAFGLPLLACLTVTLSLAGCNNTEGCGRKAWNEEFWGEPFVGTNFCEENTTDGLLGEKANSLSNFSFIYFGQIVILIATADLRKSKQNDTIKEDLFPRNAITMHPVASFTYGVSMLYLGFGSFLYHAGGNDYLHAHDQASIFIHFAILIAFGLSMFINLDSNKAYCQKMVVAIFAAFFICLFLYLNLAQMINASLAVGSFFVFIAILLGLIIGNSTWRHFKTENKPTWSSIGLGISTVVMFLVAMVVQEEFVAMPCYPKSVFQFHALWHVLTGTGFFILYLYFRSNNFSLKESLADQVEEATKKSSSETA